MFSKQRLDGSTRLGAKVGATLGSTLMLNRPRSSYCRIDRKERTL